MVEKIVVEEDEGLKDFPNNINSETTDELFHFFL